MIIAINEYLDPTVVNIPDRSEVVEPEIDGIKMKLTVEEVRELYFEYVDVFNFLSAIDNELFQLSYTDYQEMPELTMNTYTLYKYEKQKLLAEKKKGN